MRVVFAEDVRALRMVGALGPMQSDAVMGVLTIVLRPSDAGTRILWEYAVSGHLRKAGMAASTDAVLTGQILQLAQQLGAGKDSGGKTGEAGEGDEFSSDDDVAPVGDPEVEEATVDEVLAKASTGDEIAVDETADEDPPADDEAQSSFTGR